LNGNLGHLGAGVIGNAGKDGQSIVNVEGAGSCPIFVHDLSLGRLDLQQVALY
jgi:hypothetical protein